MNDQPNRLLFILLLSFFIAGVVEFTLPNAGQPINEIAFIHTFLIAVILFSWCKSHVRFNGITEPRGSALLAGIIAPIGVPLYFFRGFGLKQGSLKTLKAIGFAVVSTMAYVIGTYVGEQIGS